MINTNVGIHPQPGERASASAYESESAQTVRVSVRLDERTVLFLPEGEELAYLDHMREQVAAELHERMQECRQEVARG